MKEKIIDQPTLDEQRELNELLDHGATYVEVRGRKWKCPPLYNGAIRKMTDIILNEKDEDKVNVKCSAVFRLNSFFKIKLFYWFLWRWMYYIREYRNDELLPFIAECKKKVGVDAYTFATILLIGMRDTAMSMTRAEVEHFQAELATAPRGVSQKSTQASAKAETSSSD